jgi:hypothetical protein
LTNFGALSDDASYEIKDHYTEIYLHQFSDVQSISSEYDLIKLVVVKEGDNLFDFENHIKISVKPLDKHRLIIADLDEDILFIE